LGLRERRATRLSRGMSAALLAFPALTGRGVWKGVTRRFMRFLENIALTEAQEADGSTKQAGVRSCLNAHYYGTASTTDNSMLVGSWGKRTRIRPPRDVDVLFRLPNEVYLRFSGYSGNKQSALLQEVKGVLQKTYSDTDMRGDGQVVVVRFSASFKVEVVPAFLLTTGRYWICDTNDGGKFKEVDPLAEINAVETLNTASNGNYRHLVRMMKTWQRVCSVPIKSFQLELVAADFVRQWPSVGKPEFYYDWMTRDFFAYLIGQAHTYVFVPGTYELVPLGDAWKSMAETAYGRAAKAEEYEHDDMVIHAGEQWQKIFGTDIPLNV
jgi:hypothetical protein